MVTHILSDGTVLNDISGHTVTREDAPTVYEILERLKKKRRESHDIRRFTESQSDNKDDSNQG